MHKAIELLSDFPEYQELIRNLGTEFEDIHVFKKIRLEKEIKDGNQQSKILLAHVNIINYIELTNDKKVSSQYINYLRNHLNNAICLNNYAYCVKHGIGIQQNIEYAISLYKLGVERNNTYARHNLALYYKSCNINADETIKLLKLNINQEIYDSYFILGTCYEDGYGVAKNMYEAIRFFKLGTEYDNSSAQFHMAYCYLYGKYINKDMQKAKLLYELSASQGYTPSVNMLGHIHRDGLGIEKNIDKAMYYYQLGIKDNSRLSKFSLANIYIINNELSKAMKLLIESAQQGLPQAILKVNINAIDMYERNYIDVDDLVKIYKITKKNDLKYEIKRKVIEVEHCIMKMLIDQNLDYKLCETINNMMYQL